MKRVAIYPGSFDPITNGHIDIIRRSLTVFDKVIVVIASNLRKSTPKGAWFTPEERLYLINKVFKNEKRVNGDIWTGLMMDYAKKSKANAVLRGLRATSDFENEFIMAAMNRELNPKVETFFMMTGRNLFFVSSSGLKEISAFGGSIQRYVPDVVLKAMQEKIKKQKLSLRME